MSKNQKINLTFWTVIGWMIILFVAGLIFSGKVVAHDIHMAQGDLTNIVLTPCGDGTYALETDELGCTMLYKDGDLNHMGVHMKFLPYTEEGCVCPEEAEDND